MLSDGKKITHNQIAKKLCLDQKDCFRLRHGVAPIPRIERLVSFAKILKVDRHLIFDVACGMPAKKAYRLIKD